MVDGLREGRGKLLAKGGLILYDGEWKNDKPDGFGCKTFPLTGDRHEGLYVAGQRHGHGVYLFANGDKYTGIWSNGEYDITATVYTKLECI